MKTTLFTAMLAATVLTVTPAGYCIDQWIDYLEVPAEYPTIQDAINAATRGDIILVDSGTYTGAGNRDIGFRGKAVTVLSAHGPENTVIDCEQEGRGFYIRGFEKTDSRLDGFTIRNGYADFDGGGILCTNSSPTISNCIITENLAAGSYTSKGGGIHCDNSSMIISNCEITLNKAPDDNSRGGGIYCIFSSPIISNCTISRNLADWSGGGIFSDESDPTFSNCMMTSNTARYGGGIYCTASTSTITDCTITWNSVISRGGGIYCFSCSSTISNCKITGNSAGYEGGGAYIRNTSISMTNCILTWNMADNGGGIQCYYTFPTLTNCTVTGNTALYAGGGIQCYQSFPNITNCIFWDDSPEEIQIQCQDAPVITYSDIQGGWEGEGNIDSDPLFVAPQSEDYSLQPDSPCIDTGDPYSRLDLDDSPNDMGSYGGMGIMPEGILGGTVSGLLSIDNSPYIVSDNLVIESGDTLLVEPGVELLLHNRSGIIVHGSLHAEGTAEDSIVITDFKAWDEGGGVRFLNGEGSLAFCRIEHCRGHEGGGVYCEDSSPAFTDCVITENRATLHGGGILCNESSPAVLFCTIAGNTADKYGGGIFLDHSPATIASSLITENTSTKYGGGIYCSYSHPTITDCSITENSTEMAPGGGIHCKDSSPEILNCTLKGNHAAKNGGGISCEGSSPAITGCVITANSVIYDGGGIHCDRSSPTITDCIIDKNSTEHAFGDGGGLYCASYSNPTITDCAITGNITNDGKGGGIYCRDSSSPEITNSSITQNSADFAGGGIYCWIYSSPTIKNCTFTGNTAGYRGSGIYCSDSSPYIRDCIFWGDSLDEIHVSSGDPIIEYSDIEGGWSGAGNIDTDPLFVKGEWGDCRLLWGSPCIDTGSPGHYDQDGTRGDMGAHYFDQSKELTVYLSSESTELAPGDTGRVNCTVCNPNPYNVTFTAAAGLWLPDGTPWPGNPIEGPVYASISPAANLTGKYELRTPVGLFPGIYSLTAGVGRRDRIYDLDQSEFTVIDTGEDDRYFPNNPAEIFASWHPGELR